MWIIKIGGSWVKNPALPKLINLLQKFIKQKLVIVPGGGVFADAVRDVFKVTDMEEETGHLLAMRAMETFAYYLKSLESDLFLTDQTKNFYRKKLNVWLPVKKISIEADFIKNWDSTSDSISTWLYNNTDADGLIFVKSVSIKYKSLLELVDLQNRNILDANLKKFISVKKNLKIIGPEIIDLLENAQSWEKIISNLGVVKI